MFCSLIPLRVTCIQSFAFYRFHSHSNRRTLLPYAGASNQEDCQKSTCRWSKSDLICFYSSRSLFPRSHWMQKKVFNWPWSCRYHKIGLLRALRLAQALSTFSFLHLFAANVSAARELLPRQRGLIHKSENCLYHFHHQKRFPLSEVSLPGNVLENWWPLISALGALTDNYSKFKFYSFNLLHIIFNNKISCNFS